MSQEQEQILKAINGLVGDMATLAADVKEAKKTAAEEKEAIDKFEARFQAIEGAKKVENAKLPVTAPIDTKSGDALASKTGFKALTLKKALEIPVKHAMVRGSDQEELTLLHDYHDACAIKYQILKRKHDSTMAWSLMQKDIDYTTYRDILDRNGFVSKANEIMHPGAGSVGGTQYLDFTYTSSTMIDKMRLELVVANLFREITLTRPRQDFPRRTADGFGILAGGGAGPAATTHLTNPFPTTAHFSTPTYGSRKAFSVKHLMVLMEYNDDMIEDSFIPFLSSLQEDVGYFGARTLDRSILDGDITGTHMDTDTAAAIAGGALDFRAAWYGLRKMALANNKVDAGTGLADDTDLHNVRAGLGVYGKNPARCAYITSLTSFYGLVKLGVIGTNNNLNAPAAGLASSGTIANWWGIPIYVSEFVRMDVANTGVNASSGNTFGVLYCVNTDRFVRARYGTFQLEDTRVAPMLMNIIQSDVRLDFGAWDEHTLTSGVFAAGESPCTVLYNIS